MHIIILRIGTIGERIIPVLEATRLIQKQK